MARLIGASKSWTWWLLGAVCAYLFGQNATAAEPGAEQPEYGVRVRPPKVKPAVDVTDEQREQANDLIDAYLKPVEPEAPTAAAKEAIAGQTALLGLENAQTQRVAATALLEYGREALGALREAVQQGGANAAAAARVIAQIEAQARQKAIGNLKGMNAAGRAVLAERLSAASRTLTACRKALAEARKDGDEEAITSAQTAMENSAATYSALLGLQRRVYMRFYLRPRFLLSHLLRPDFFLRAARTLVGSFLPGA